MSNKFCDSRSIDRHTMYTSHSFGSLVEVVQFISISIQCIHNWNSFIDSNFVIHFVFHWTWNSIWNCSKFCSAGRDRKLQNINLPFENWFCSNYIVDEWNQTWFVVECTKLYDRSGWKSSLIAVFLCGQNPFSKLTLRMCWNYSNKLSRIE